jgi:putative transposase
LERLRKATHVFEIRVHAYCLMGNHLHLLVETSKPNLSQFGQRLFASYTLWYNRKHRRVGHLLQGRFKSFLVGGEGYLAELSRYIHLNPVRAGMTDKPETYRWSSLGRYAMPGSGEKWVVTREILKRFEGSRKAYLEYVYEGIGATWKPTVVNRLVIGTEAFARQVLSGTRWMDGRESGKRPLTDREEVRKARILREVADRYGVTREALARKRSRGTESKARRVAMAALRRALPLTYGQIGALLGGISSPGTVQAIRQAESESPAAVQAIVRSLSN